MQFTNVFGLAVVAGLVQAAPLITRNTGLIIFHGAAGAQYSLNVPLDGTTTYTNNVLSISTISSDVVDVANQCSLKTVDYTPALVEGPAHTWAVGPPQTVISIACSGTPPPNPGSIEIEFDGADPDQGAKYSLTVPLDGSVILTNNALSISTLVSSYASLRDKCTFKFVDYPAALVLIKDGPVKTWAAGPPQTILSVSCT